jgi:hypothetical protein
MTAPDPLPGMDELFAAGEQHHEPFAPVSPLEVERAALKAQVDPQLLPALHIAVRREIEALWGSSVLHDDAQRDAFARACVQEIAEHGEMLTYLGRSGQSSTAFVALARILALLAFSVGGVTFAGRHWCAGSGHLGAQVPWPCDEEIERDRALRATHGERPCLGLGEHRDCCCDRVAQAADDLDDERPDCECDDCLALAEEPAVRTMVTLQPRSEFL